MSHDLVYTSAPQGLKPGSRGFCTVASTAGIAKNLTERLESFSGYRHAFMAHEAGGRQNPVNYAHYHTTVGGRKYHILSRIADAGLDYTQRSNKLAHHVALESGEVAASPGGPAWVMADDGFFVDRWDGQVRTLASGSQPVRSDRPAGVCQRWKELTGDAGWGGVLAESGLRKGGVMSVIFPAGTSVLELVVEALALVPRERRWQVTFSTYFTKAPAGVDCQWRFLLDGTPEATALRRDVRATVIDLCQPQGQAQGGDLVELARTGVLIQRSESLGAAPAQRVAAAPPRMPSGPPARGGATDDVRLAPPVLPPPTVADSPVPAPDWLSSSRAASGRWLLFGVGAVSLIAMGLVMGAVLFGGRETVPPVEIAEAPLTPEPSEILPEEDEDDPIDQEPMEEEPPEEMPDLPEVDVEPKPEATEPDEPEEEQPPPDPFADIRARQNRLRLPPLTITEGGDALTSVGAFANTSLNRKAVELARIDVKDNAHLDLQLGGNEFQPRRDQDKFAITPVDKDSERRWEVTTESPTAIGGSTEIRNVATFSLLDGALRFNWESTDLPFRLAFCTLTLTVGDDSEICYFDWETQRKPRIQLRDEALTRYDLPNFSEFSLRTDDNVSLEVKFTGIPGIEYSETGTKLTLQQRNTAIRLPLEFSISTMPKPQVSVGLTFQHETESESEIIKSMWIKTIPLGYAPQLQRTTELVDQPWNLSHWRKSIRRIDATTSAIRKSFQSINKQVDTLVNTHRTFAQKSHHEYPHLRKWEKESPHRRRLALEKFPGYRELQVKISEISTEKSGLDKDYTFLAGLKKKSHQLDTQQENRIRYLEGQLPKLEKQIRELETKTNQWIAEMPDLSKTYKDYEFLESPNYFELLKTHSFFLDFQDELNVWFNTMREFPTDLRNNGRLDYRLYVTIDGREIDLVITKGFPDRAAEVGDAN